MEDYIIKKYTKDDISVLDKVYCHRNHIVARNIYRFKNDNGCITYQKGICGESGTLMFLIEVEDNPHKLLDKDIMTTNHILLFVI